jgi:hypothetical protein
MRLHASYHPSLTLGSGRQACVMCALGVLLACCSLAVRTHATVYQYFTATCMHSRASSTAQ